MTKSENLLDVSLKFVWAYIGKSLSKAFETFILVISWINLFTM